MSIKLICAISKNNVIGNENKLPWNISEDLKRFKELTSNNWIVMRTEKACLRNLLSVFAERLAPSLAK